MSNPIQEAIQAFGDSFRVNDVRIYPKKNELHLQGTIQSIEPRTMCLLCYLVLNKDEVCGREQLTTAIWVNQYVNKDSITRTISDLRKALGDHASNPSFIRTIPKRGYQFIGAINEGTTIISTPIQTPPAKNIRSYAAYTLVACVLMISSIAVWEWLQTPTIGKKTIVKSVPVIVRDTVAGDIPDSLLQKEIEAIVDAVVDEVVRD